MTMRYIAICAGAVLAAVALQGTDGDALDYQVALSNAATRDPVLHKLCVEVRDLVKSASAVHSPEVMERVKALNA